MPALLQAVSGTTRAMCNAQGTTLIESLREPVYAKGVYDVIEFTRQQQQLKHEMSCVKKGCLRCS